MTPPSDRPARRRALLDALAALALLALPLLLYRQALGLWWMEDDFFQLRFALDHGPLAYGLDPEVWRLLPNRVLSPLLFASYDLDLALFGLDTRAFYAHQLVSIGLAAAALFLVLRLWLPRVWAALGGAVFLLGTPLGGYGFATTPTEWPGLALALPGKVGRKSSAVSPASTAPPSAGTPPSKPSSTPDPAASSPGSSDRTRKGPTPSC